MGRVEASIDVNAPLVDVFAFASDWRHWDDWWEGASGFGATGCSNSRWQATTAPTALGAACKACGDIVGGVNGFILASRPTVMPLSLPRHRDPWPRSRPATLQACGCLPCFWRSD
jgi:hypothetical protein